MNAPQQAIDPNKARISRNVDKMLAAGAPESEVEEYLQSEGLKPTDQAPADRHGFAGPAPETPKPDDPYNYGSRDALLGGLTAGFADEIGSAIQSGSLFNGPEYDRQMARRQEGAERYKAEHGMANLGAEAVGTILPSLATGGANIAARVGVRNLLGRAAIEQGALGALYGAGNASQGHRTKGAVLGGVGGGLLGAGSHAALKAAQAVAEVVPGVNTLGRKLGMLPKPGEKADKLILDRLAQDDLTPGDIRFEVQGRPDTKPETLLDLGEENVTSLGKLAVNSPGKGRRQFGEMVAERQAAAPGRVSDDLTSAGMNPVNKYATVEALEEAKQRASRPLYEAALQGNSVDDEAINAFLRTPEGHAAFRFAQAIRRREAESLALQEGRALRPDDYALPEIYEVNPHPAPAPTGTAMVRHGSGEGLTRPAELVGDLELRSVPDDRTLHYMKLALDDMAKYGYVPPGGTESTKNFASKKLVNAFRTRIGKLIPGYDDAANMYSAGHHMKTAFEDGTTFLKEDAVRSAREVAEMTGPEKEAFRLGAGTGVRRAADMAPDGSDIARRVFGSPEKRNQIAAALDDPAAMEALTKEMARESRMAQVNRLQGGSHTQPMAMEGADAAKALGVLSSLVQGNVGGAAWRMTQRLGNGMTPEVTDALSARLLSGRGGRQELMSALDALTEAQKARLSKSGALASLIAAMSGGATGASVR